MIVLTPWIVIEMFWILQSTTRNNINNQRNDEEMDNTINNKEVIENIRIKTCTLTSDSLSTLLFMLLI